MAMPRPLTPTSPTPGSTPTPGYTLPIMESFYTLQGEGFHTGRPAWFIRTGGCDVGCSWCDVKESWNEAAHPRRSIEQLMRQMARYPVEVVVVTGGEPLMHNLQPLTEALQARGLRTHIETSGAHPLSGRWDWICFSPKKFKAPLPEVAAAANELKVIVYNRHDFQWAEQHAASVSPSCQLFLQPEWSRAATITPAIIDYVKANPRWRISLQTHKYLNIP
jgi:7-carboxy-7-deazaguanine synthase